MSSRLVPCESPRDAASRRTSPPRSSNTGRYNMASSVHHSSDLIPRKGTRKLAPFLACLVGIAVGMVIGLLFPQLALGSFRLDASLLLTANQTDDALPSPAPDGRQGDSANTTQQVQEGRDIPAEAKDLPLGIVEKTTDLYMRRLWGRPEEDLETRPKYLLAMAVGIPQLDNVNKMVAKFPKETTTIVLLHYDGVVSEWHAMEWAKSAIHVAAKKQTKWWFAKRFLHPDVVEPYDFIFIWDEDLGVEAFDVEEYIRIVRRYGFEISQPSLFPDQGVAWEMTKRKVGREAHTMVLEPTGWCTSVRAPPCAGFVEIMAPVFSRAAWRCVWYLIQNDLVHGWGLDLALGKCAQGAPYRKIGVVDSVWVSHLGIPSLGNQGEATTAGAAWQSVRDRCRYEMDVFKQRLQRAEQLLPPSNWSTAQGASR